MTPGWVTPGYMRQAGKEQDHADRLCRLLAADPVRARVLALVGGLGLPNCWIGAGFVRNAVWDWLHGRAAAEPPGDVDVVWFDAGRSGRAADRAVEAELRSLEPGLDWSVKNQSRMHMRNGDPAYRSTGDALHHWPDTATAVAARRTAEGRYEFLAPYGFDDLFGLVLRPTPRFRGARHGVFLERVCQKRWLERWPLLRMAEAGS